MKVLILLFLVSCASHSSKEETFSNGYAIYHCYGNSDGDRVCDEARSSDSYYR
jgi:hypothetical protein